MSLASLWKRLTLGWRMVRTPTATVTEAEAVAASGTSGPRITVRWSASPVPLYDAYDIRKAKRYFHDYRWEIRLGRRKGVVTYEKDGDEQDRFPLTAGPGA